MRRGEREATPLALILLDVDHFKRFNDTYGHPGGDACLRSVAAAVAAAATRPADLAARYGGEEFAVILPGVDLEGGRVVAERIRRSVLELGMPHVESHLGFVTVSLGVAGGPPAPGLLPETLVGAADDALYRAKAGGRNRLEVSSLDFVSAAA